LSVLDDLAFAPLGRRTSRRAQDVAFDEALLHLDDLAHGVDDAAKLDEAAVAGALESACNAPRSRVR